MANGQSGVFTGGAGLVWRRQRVLWWAFIINFILASYAARIITNRAATVLDNSLASIPLLVQGYHISGAVELGNTPEVYLKSGNTPMFFSLIFFFFMLLATGGILEAYWRDETLSTGEFFRSGGTYFWRFFRLVIFLLLVLIPFGLICWGVSAAGDAIDDRSISPYPWVWFMLGAGLALILLLMSIRLWFDMAEVIAVAESETRSRKCLRRAFGLLRKNFGSLFWLYLRISIVGCIGVAVGLQVWVHRVKPASITTSLLVSQLIVLFWLAIRFWHRASEALWYKNYLERPGTESVVPGFTPPDPQLAASVR
jgi:hypothetical protein